MMPTKTICAVVVLYNPEEEVYDNILTYADGVEKIYIVDNSEGNCFSIEALEHRSEKSSFVLLSCEGNIGVAAALDIALRQAYREGYQWLLTMDQDGSFETEEFEKVLQCVNRGENSKVLLKAPLHTSKIVHRENRTPCHLEKVDIVMTSGNMVHIANAIQIGGYDKKLFIDEVDHEFCLRGQRLGYATLLFSSIYVNHTLGRVIKVGKRYYRIYPPQRVYYMLRNYLYVREKYKCYRPLFFKKRTRFLQLFFLQHLLYSPQRAECFYMLLRGWYDYKRCKFGSLYEA